MHLAFLYDVLLLFVAEIAVYSKLIACKSYHKANILMMGQESIILIQSLVNSLWKLLNLNFYSYHMSLSIKLHLVDYSNVVLGIAY